MPVITQGNSATITFNDADSLTVQAGSGTATFEQPVGTVVAVFTGSRTFGPFSKTTGKITATVQDTYYEFADGGSPVVDRVPGIQGSNDSAAASNTAKIQAMLDLGGKVVVDAGENVMIAGPLLIGDNTDFSTAPGTTLRQVNGNNNLLLGTKQLFAPYTNVTVSWSSGDTATVAMAAHGCSVGDAIVLQGASTTVWWDVYRVVAVADADNLTIRLPFVITSSPVPDTTGAITGVAFTSLKAKRCHRSIKVDVTLDYNFAGNPTATQANWQRMTSVFAFVSDSNFVVRGKDGYKYITQLNGAIDCYISGEALPFSNSDTVKLYGPLRDPRARGVGQGPEDCISTQNFEPPAFIAYMAAQGNIINPRFLDCDSRVTTAGSGALVLYNDGSFTGPPAGSGGFTTDGASVEGGFFRSSAASTPAINLRSGVGFTPAASLTRSIAIRNAVVGASAATGIDVNTLLRKLVIQNTTFIPPTAATNRLVRVASPSVVDQLVIDKQTFELGAWPPATGYILEVANGATARQILVRDTTIRASSALRAIFLPNGCSCSDIMLDGVDASGISQLVQIDATPTVTPTVTFRGGNYAGTTYALVSTKAAGVVVIDGANVADASNGVVRVDSGVTATLEVRGAAKFTGTTRPYVCLNSAKVILRAPQLVVDVGQLVNATTGALLADGTSGAVLPLALSIGAECIHFNASTARGTLPANVQTPVICDGTKWISKLDSSKTYTPPATPIP